MFIHNLSIFLMLPGIFFMLAALIMSLKMQNVLPEASQRKWRMMSILLAFFSCGYIFYLILQVLQFNFPLELITSSVFFGGSLYVFLVVNMTQGIIRKIRKSEEDTRKANKALTRAYDSTIEGWGKALELRDEETEGHTQRVTEMTLLLCRVMCLDEEQCIQARRGALLHDIGKMAISDSILLKEGSFTPEERQVMQKHPVYAYQMLSSIGYLYPALDIPYCHHEKWDGTGYPRGLRGDEIPLAARIFAVADIWDALTNERRYHRAWSKDKAREHIKSLAGTHLDPHVVEKFLELVA
ncbi:HD domain-containing protein [Desulfopila sp. IMCC35006]|uniref:HD-GYP domain-containing protein n=1 Tax=Desulfopila sp. IMCC35006 TaxID=2569542 RepID=UPI0010AD5B3F|nr:HD-GYP domain-containing protein [Desulfopila sp. IMCC35006]TKB25142.1 HD domain-containing protein [Desulfopila sp. IMCC35006]